jgi:capsular exopolysaccharide synthesis family protein
MIAAGANIPPVPAAPAAREIGPREGRHALEYLSVLHRRRRVIAAVVLLFAAAAVLRALTTPPVYTATAQLLIGRNPPQVLEFKEVMQLDSQGWGDEYHLTQLKLLGSRALSRRAVERLELARDPLYAKPRVDGSPADVEDVVDAFRARVKVRRLEHSQIFAITVEAPRAELAAAGANAVAEAFIEEAARTRSDTNAQASAWLAAQIEEQRRKVKAAEEALERLGAESGILNFEERRLLVDQKLKQLAAHLTERQARRLESEGLYRHMRSVADPQELSAVIGNRVFQDLRMELAQFERRETELLEGRHLDQHPEVVKVRAQIARARAGLAAEAARIVSAAENDYRSAAVQEQELARALESTQAEALALHRRGLRWEALKRDLDANQAVMSSLLARSKQTDVAQELRATPIRIVDRATVPDRPARPRKRRDVALAVLLGLGAGLGLALLTERFDPRLRTPADVRARLGVPVLAVVPEAAGPSAPAGPDADPDGAPAEAYRSLRSALDRAWSGDGGRVVVVGSGSAREGKTVTAAGLAWSLAARGDVVLLVDADLRRPEAHAVLRANRTPGLVDVLGGRAAIEDTLQEVDGTRLKFLGSGSAPASPADALRPEGLRALLEGLRARFRWIVVDTAPVGVASDALALGASDGVLLVVASALTRTDAAAEALARFADGGARVLGVVLNRARLERFPFDHGVRSRGGRSVKPAPAGGPELAAAE